MVIEEEDFRLTPINDFCPHFDLELLYTIKPKGKETRKEFKTVAYGVSLESAIKKVIQHRINQKHNEEAITLKDYLKEFKEISQSLESTLKL